MSLYPGVRWLQPTRSFRVNFALVGIALAVILTVAVAFREVIRREVADAGPWGLPFFLAGVAFVATLLLYAALHALWYLNRVGVDGNLVYVRTPWGYVRSARGGPDGEVLTVRDGDRPQYLLVGPLVVPLRWGKYGQFSVYRPEEESLLAGLGRSVDRKAMDAHLRKHDPVAYWILHVFRLGLVTWAVLLGVTLTRQLLSLDRRVAMVFLVMVAADVAVVVGLRRRRGLAPVVVGLLLLSGIVSLAVVAALLLL